jgi:AAA domain
MPVVTKQSNKATKSKTSTVLSRIRPIEFNDDGLKLNVYGMSGTGKTTFWGTFPKPILAIVCSGGGELRSLDTPEYRKTIKQFVPEDTSELKEIVEYQEQTGGYATVVLDHASGLQDMVMKEILGLEKLPEQASWGMASQQQYGQCAMKVKEYLRAIISLKCNIVIVAQEREFNTDNTDNELLMPYVASALSPSIVGWLNPVCDYIVQTFKRNKVVTTKTKVAGKEIVTTKKTRDVEYCLRVGPDATYTTKFRLPKGYDLPPAIVDPTYDKLIELIQGAN